MFRLLPVQILLAGIGAVNGIVASFFASNYVGIDAMSAVGLYGPINMLISAFSIMLAGGSAVLCGRYIGRNEQENVQRVYTLNLLLTGLIAAAGTALIVAAALLKAC